MSIYISRYEVLHCVVAGDGPSFQDFANQFHIFSDSIIECITLLKTITISYTGMCRLFT